MAFGSNFEDPLIVLFPLILSSLFYISFVSMDDINTIWLLQVNVPNTQCFYTFKKNCINKKFTSLMAINSISTSLSLSLMMPSFQWIISFWNEYKKRKAKKNFYKYIIGKILDFNWNVFSREGRKRKISLNLQ